MNSENETKREIRSFIVGRDPSIDRRFRPKPKRQVCLFDGTGIEEESDSLENSVEDSEGNTFESDDCSEGAQVYLRLRPVKPISSAYEVRGNVLVLGPSSENTSTSNNRNVMEKHYTFTDIFDPEIPQSSVFENCVRRKIEGEESFTLLTYGTSGSGKTFTLLGQDSQPGIIPRALEQIFTMYEPKIYPNPSLKLINGRMTLIEDCNYEEVELRTRLLSNCVKSEEIEMARSRILQDHDFDMVLKEDSISVFIWISFVEIYNENVYDLLESPSTSAHPTAMAPPPRKNLKIVGNDGKAFIKGLTSVYVKNCCEAIHLLRYGLQRVNYAATSVNANSSRSHCIFFVDVLKYFQAGQFTETSYKFCDLAGSERLHKTGNVGSRLKEAQRINTSLLVLGRCLDAVSGNRKKPNDVVPYRESKLTMLLQASLLGKEKLSMIVNVMPTDKYYEENVNVLGFASIAKNIIFKKPLIKSRKSRCSFLLDFTNASDVQDDERKKLFEEAAYWRNQVERLISEHSTEKYVLEQEIRTKLTNSHQAMIEKIIRQHEERLKTALENAKRQYESQLQKLKREHQWAIEDLQEELEAEKENKPDLKRRRLSL